MEYLPPSITLAEGALKGPQSDEGIYLDPQHPKPLNLNLMPARQKTRARPLLSHNQQIDTHGCDKTERTWVAVKELKLSFKNGYIR